MNNYLILSSDSVTINNYINEIITKEKVSISDVIKYDLSEVLLEKVIEELNTYSFLNEKKAVIAYSAFFLSRDKKRGEPPQNEKLLEQYLDNPNPSNILIIVIDNLDKTKKISKLLKDKTIIYEKPLVIDDIVKQNLEDYIMDFKTLKYFISIFDNDNVRLLNELEKLKMYKFNDKVITIDDIDLICIKKVNDDIFSLINSIVNKQKDKAFKIYKELLNRGEDINKITIMVCDQFRLIYRVKLLLKDGKSLDNITKMLNIHPYRVKLASEASYNFSITQLEKYLIDLGQIDINNKTGKSGNSYEFDIFLLSI